MDFKKEIITNAKAKCAEHAHKSETHALILLIKQEIKL